MAAHQMFGVPEAPQSHQSLGGTLGTPSSWGTPPLGGGTKGPPRFGGSMRDHPHLGPTEGASKERPILGFTARALPTTLGVPPQPPHFGVHQVAPHAEVPKHPPHFGVHQQTPHFGGSMKSHPHLGPIEGTSKKAPTLGFPTKTPNFLGSPPPLGSPPAPGGPPQTYLAHDWPPTTPTNPLVLRGDSPIGQVLLQCHQKLLKVPPAGTPHFWGGLGGK